MSTRSRDRPGDLAAVLPPLDLRAGAPVVARIGVVLPTAARVAGEDEHCPRGIGGVLLSSGDGDLPRLQRLPQRLHDIGREQRELVEEQHPEVGLAHLARPYAAGAATEDAGAGRGVVRRPEGRPDDPGCARRKGPAERVDSRELQRLVVGEVGQQPRDALGEGGLAGALGTGEHQVVATGSRDLHGVARVLHADDVGHVEVLQAFLAAPAEQRRTRQPLHLRRFRHLVVTPEQRHDLRE